MTLPVVHIHGGEVTSTVDEMVRHAISKLSHLHLVATKESAERLKRMGEDPWRIHIVGAPGLDEKSISAELLVKKYNLDLSKPAIIVLQHPVTTEIEASANQMRETMEAVKEVGCQAIVIYPNADPGGRKMIEVIERYRKFPFVRIYENIPRGDFLSLMRLAKIILGNSSSGIIEAPLFHLPAINIGTRQCQRERTENVIDVGYSKEQIKKAIKTLINGQRFRGRVKKHKNPYSNIGTERKIAEILSSIEINKKLLEKQIAY